MTKEDRAFGIRLFHAVSVIIQRFALVALSMPVADDGAKSNVRRHCGQVWLNLPTRGKFNYIDGAFAMRVWGSCPLYKAVYPGSRTVTVISYIGMNPVLIPHGLRNGDPGTLMGD